MHFRLAWAIVIAVPLIVAWGGSIAAASTITTCTRAAVADAVAAGGSHTFACDGRIVMSTPLSVGTTVSFDAAGRDVTFAGGKPGFDTTTAYSASDNRVVKVTPTGNLTLTGINVEDGLFVGGPGAAGQDGASGTSGAFPGGAGGNGMTSGAPGTTAPASRGGCILVEAGGRLVLRALAVRRCQAASSPSGAAGVAGGGGAGGAGTTGASGVSGTGQNGERGGNGGSGGNGVPGVAGVAGSPAEGGAIYSLGTLDVGDVRFEDNLVRGGRGGYGGQGGGGGSGGRGGNGGNPDPTGGTAKGGDSGTPGAPGLAYPGGPGGVGGAAHGGAVYAGGETSIAGSHFARNAAYGGASGRGGEGGDGGQAANGTPGRVQLGSGAGDPACAVPGNPAQYRQCGQYTFGGASAGSDGGANGNGGDALGGAVFFQGVKPRPVNTTNDANKVEGGSDLAAECASVNYFYGCAPGGTGGQILSLGCLNAVVPCTFAPGGFRGLLGKPGMAADPDVASDQVAGLSVLLDGFESGPDEVTLTSTLRNLSTDGAVTDLVYPGGANAGLIFNTAPYSPENRGALALFSGPLPSLPPSLAPTAQSQHGYVVRVTKQGVVMVRARADGRDASGRDVSATSYVEIAATPYTLDQVQAQAVFAGAYTSLADGIQADAAAAITRSMNKVESAMKRFGPDSADKDLKRNTPSEDLLAELYGLPAGSLDFLPDKVASYLLWSEARSQGEWKSWKSRINSLASATVKEPLQFWDNQIRGSDPATKFRFGQELWKIAGEKKAGLQGFSADAWSLVSTKSAKEVFDGMPGLVGEYRDAVKGAVKKGLTISTAKANQIAREFREGDSRGIKASAEWFADGEVSVSAAMAKGAISNLVGTQLSTIVRVKKVVAPQAAAIEAAEDILGGHGTLADLIPRTITDGLAAPTAKQLGMSAADEGLISGVLDSLEDKAARLGYPGLDLEAAFRSRGYSAPGAIGKVQYIKGKTGAAIDLLLGMHKSGLGNNSIYKPSLPKFFKDLPSEIRTALKLRLAEQAEVYEQWALASKGKKSKLTEMFKATGKKGNTFVNEVAGEVADKTFMRLAERKVGNTTILLYKDLVVNGTKIVENTLTSIGSDFDGLYLGLKNGLKLPAGVVNGLWIEANQQFAKLARDKGFAWGFHGFSRDAFDFGDKLFQKTVWQYIAEGLPEADARRLFGYKSEDVLSKMTFGQYAVKVTKEGATTGVLAP